MAQEFIKMSYYIGVGGVVTFKNAKKLKETVEAIPLERILLETDCPYMTPEPHRGTRNDSSNIPFVIANRRIKRNHSGGGRACDGGECGKVIHKSVLIPQHPSRTVSEYSVPVIRVGACFNRNTVEKGQPQFLESCFIFRIVLKKFGIDVRSIYKHIILSGAVDCRKLVGFIVNHKIFLRKTIRKMLC